MAWRAIALISTLVACASGTILPGDPRHEESQHHVHHDQLAVSASQPQQRLLPLTYISSQTPYVLNPNGAYGFRYHLSDGSYKFARGDGTGEVAGGFGFRAPTGEEQTIEYTAGIQGYRPVGPGVPDLPAPVSPSALPYVAAEQDPLYDANSDASYSFGFSAEGYARDETSDADGNVVGSYSYVDATGVPRTVTYRAGEGIGFVPDADFLSEELKASYSGNYGLKTTTSSVSSSSPVIISAASTHSQTVVPAPNSLPASTFSLPELSAKTPLAPVVAEVRKADPLPITASASAASSSSSSAFQGYSYPRPAIPSNLYELPAPAPAPIPEPPVVEVEAAAESQIREQQVAPSHDEHDHHAHVHCDENGNCEEWDASYNFAFNAGQAGDRQEQSDPKGNVRGQYSYVNEDGNVIVVRYRAGADTGFVIENEQELASSVARATIDGAATAEAKRLTAAPYATEEATGVFRSEPLIDADMVQRNSYAFGYSSSQGSRQEEADDNGIVHGSYVIFGADGAPVTVRYRAGADIGFVVDNLEEVVAASTPTEATGAAAGATGGVAVEVVGVRTAGGGSTFGGSSSTRTTSNTRTSNTRTSSSSGSRFSGATAQAGLPFGSRSRTVTTTTTTTSGNSGRRTGSGFVGATRFASSSSSNTGGVASSATRSGLTRSSTATFSSFPQVTVAQPPIPDPVARAQPPPPRFRARPRPVASSVRTQTSQFSSTSMDELNNLALPVSPVAQQSQRRRVVVRPRPRNNNINKASSKKVTVNTYEEEENADKSYAFGFQEEGSTRFETSDEDGNIRGQYSYINAEGNEIVVKYRASPDGGFVVENEDELSATVAKATLDGAAAAVAARTAQHRQQYEQSQLLLNTRERLPAATQDLHASTKTTVTTTAHGSGGLIGTAGIVAPAAAASGARRTVVVKKRKRPTHSASSKTTTTTTTRRFGSTSSKSSNNVASDYDYDYYDDDKDASFAFSYTGQEASEHVTADSTGERSGSYSYVNPEGRRVVVRYRAGRKGFQILNPDQVLPKHQ